MGYASWRSTRPIPVVSVSAEGDEEAVAGTFAPAPQCGDGEQANVNVVRNIRGRTPWTALWGSELRTAVNQL